MIRTILTLALFTPACSTADAVDLEPAVVATVLLYSADGETLDEVRASAVKTVDKAGDPVTAYAEFAYEPHSGDDVTFYLDDGREWRGLVIGRTLDAGGLTLRVASVPQRW